MAININPIAGVRVTNSGTYTSIPCPTKYDWKLSDISSPDAGRTEDGQMQKMRLSSNGSKVHLELEWANVGDITAKTILTAFQPEYIYVNYYDYKSMAFVEKQFYVGDRSVVTYNRHLAISTVTFNIIER